MNEDLITPRAVPGENYSVLKKSKPNTDGIQAKGLKIKDPEWKDPRKDTSHLEKGTDNAEETKEKRLQTADGKHKNIIAKASHGGNVGDAHGATRNEKKNNAAADGGKGMKLKAKAMNESVIVYVPEYINLSEGLTEYQLMQILDENNCTTTDEDVNLLVEAIETGKVLLETRVTDKIAGLDKEPDYDSSELAKDNTTGETKERSRITHTDTHPRASDRTASSEIVTRENNETGLMNASVDIAPKGKGSKGLGGHGEADNKIGSKMSIDSHYGNMELKVEDEYAKVPEERKDEARKALKRKAAKRAMKNYSDSADEEVRKERYNRLVEKHGKEKADKLIAFEEKKKAKPKLAVKQK